MKTIVVAAALALGLTGAAASAQDAQGAEATPKEEKKICRTDKSTGSLTRRTRVCMTESQWREFGSRTYRGVSQMQGEGSGGQPAANNAGAGG
jgi:Spy/CpxP family protein refolding chaperone